ncbi:RagB/SusD family nutrient uptake outer membrane protein [Mariniflexile jejuense]|uniref:RagB/SusD family nutrient uptake outer membrane protein n=1 Tax=Mariniflexile jejuense TaxID=1173582 RepID=A0ABW3JKC7_9FLAO
MKNIKINNLLVILALILLSSCSTDFIEEKKDYSSVNIKVYQEESLAIQYLDYLYNAMFPGGNSNMAMWSKAAAEHSASDLFAKATDEVAGEVDINKAWAQISATEANCLKSLGTKLTSSASRTDAYTRIRHCNLYLDNVDNYTGLEEDFKNQIKGQFYFWRAWQYFELVRLYGGVPLVLNVQGANVDDPSVQIPRSTSAQVINQIVSDLDMAKNLLTAGRPYTAAQAGRITASAAAALKGRVLLTWASPLFNRTDDKARWQRAYDANLDAYNICVVAGKGLNADWKNMWFQDNNKESIFAFGFNNDATNSDISENNYTEYQSRSRAQGGNGTISPTKNIMDAFPMADGTPYNPNGNLNHFYRNRDPRFYHTFAYNGCIWPYAGNANYRNWTYFWHINTDPNGVVRPTDIVQNTSGVYLRKFTNDLSANTNSFKNSGADYMEIRFAEVVLNLAESAIGIDKLSEGKGYIKTIRARAGVTNSDGDYGLASVTTRDQHFAAVINERKVEFAYENKRFHDLRRWMLYNDDFGTCTRLNQKPIEGSRRQGYYTIAKRDVNTQYSQVNPDPFLGASAPIINRDATTYPSGITTYAQYLDYLYDNYFEVIVRDNVDAASFSFKWYNEYYFFGIYQDLLNTAPYLKQTQGWGGTFDPIN